MTPQKHHRELMTWLRDEYRATDLRVVAGRRHPRIAFTYDDREHTFTQPSSPGDAYRGLRNARAELRRLLGPPKPKEEPMHVQAKGVEPFNAPRVLPAQPVMPKTLSGEGTVAYYKSTRYLTIRIPRAFQEAFSKAKLGWTFTAPDTFEVTPLADQSLPGPRFIHYKSHGSSTIKICFYVKATAPVPFDFFNALKAECLIEGDTLLLRTLTHPPLKAQQEPIEVKHRTFTGKVYRGKARAQFVAEQGDLGALMDVSFTVTDTGADSWELRCTRLRGASFRLNSATGRVTLDSSQPFTTEVYPVSPAVFTVIDDRVLVKVTRKAVVDKPVQQKLVNDFVEKRDLPPTPELKMSFQDQDLRSLLDAVRRVEATTPYRLRRVRDKNDREILRWEAPRIE